MNKLDEILSETQCDLENTKSIFSESIMEKCIFDGLRRAGYLDEVVEVESSRNGVHVGEKISKRGADLVKSLLDGRVLFIVLAYFVSPEYYFRLALLLKNSYNYYYGDKGWSFTEVMCKHFFILEDNKFAGFREIIPGVKYLTTDEFLKGVAMRKFDLIVGNPPYNLGKETRVDLKIHKVFEDELDDKGKIVFVHPAGFFLSHKYGVSPKNPIDAKKLESIHMFWGNGMFEIGSFTPLCVTVWNKAKTNDDVTVIDDAYTYSTYECKSDKIHIYGAKDYEWICSWLNSNVDYSTSISSKAIKVQKKVKTMVTLPYAFAFSTMRGTPANGNDIKFKDDFFTIVPKESDKITPHLLAAGAEVKYNNVFEFNTEKERTNFINYLKTKAVRFILSLSKVDKNLLYGELNQIPWMDFTRSYSDRDICEKWNIDEKLWKFIDEHIPAYYPDWHFDGIY